MATACYSTNSSARRLCNPGRSVIELRQMYASCSMLCNCAFFMTGPCSWGTSRSFDIHYRSCRIHGFACWCTVASTSCLQGVPAATSDLQCLTHLISAWLAVLPVAQTPQMSITANTMLTRTMSGWLHLALTATTRCHRGRHRQTTYHCNQGISQKKLVQKAACT